jgi:Domain of unknown function (DUF4326)
VPERIQLSRAAGGHLPAGAVVVSRTTRWGNPFIYRSTRGLARVPGVFGGGDWEHEGRGSADGVRHVIHHGDGRVDVCHIRYMTRLELVDGFRRLLLGDEPWPPGLAGSLLSTRTLGFAPDDVRRELRGRDLACWCPRPAAGEADVCHAAVLLEVAGD